MTDLVRFIPVTILQVKVWLDSVDKLELPANPLDRLLNELGGPDKGTL